MSQRNAPPVPPQKPANPAPSESKQGVGAEPEAAAPVPPRRAGFQRPNTPTTPFSPQNPLHQALMTGAIAQNAPVAPGPRPAAGMPAEAPRPVQQTVTPSSSGAYITTPMPPASPNAPSPPAAPQASAAYAPAAPVTPVTPVTPGWGNPRESGVKPEWGAPEQGPSPFMQQQGPGGVAYAAPPAPIPAPAAGIGVHAHAPQQFRAAHAHVVRGRAYAFVLDANGNPIEIGSGRFGKVYLGEERWLDSKTDFRRQVVIKVLQKGVSDEDLMRFQLEKELLERVQGHPSIVELFASGEGEDPEFLPASIRDKVESEFVILEKLQMSLEERLKGSRSKGEQDDLLACSMNERVFRVLDYMIPIASAVEFAHLVKNISHRDIKPANILIGLPDPNLRGSTLEVRLADFNVAKVQDEELNIGMTRMKSVPGTLFFQSPEQETNVIELLVNVTTGSPEVEYFEDFYIQIAKNDTFSLFNRAEQYPILYADRAKKKILLARPWREPSESNVRAKIQKSVGRPADIYSLGALFYYLISGAYANPKTLYDNFHKFIEYERPDENNTIEAYLAHEYSVINSMRAPKSGEGTDVAPADRFFSYKHYLDGNGELIENNVMRIIAKCMIRNKPDSYCQAHDLDTRGISDLVQELIDLYTVFGVHPMARPQNLARMARASGGRGALLRSLDRFGNRLRWMWLSLLAAFRSKKK
ncbi:protein kinase [Pendulispora brunnea]|uniref:non-specific serine/threonine protein kinase n=1 Tax=Pendulispora brunnea TaxID=2905690 RepID=A0ABZ2KQD7_9BACT